MTPAKPPLLTLSNVPSWFDANPFIHTGYRPESQSWRKSLASWLYIHNETGNIFSHLIPGISLLLTLLLGLPASTSTDTDPKATNPTPKQEEQDRTNNIVITVQLCAAILCLLTSALYHTGLNHSARVAHQALQCDHGGILMLILGNFVSGLHFGFYCAPALKNLYWSLIVASSTGTGICLLSPWFRGSQWRFVRLSSCIATGLFAFAPISHAGYLWGPGYLMRVGVPYYLLEGALLLFGCYLFQTRIPESLYPGRFDIWGHSHTLWHVLVALSIVAHMGGLLSAREYNDQHAPCRVF
ncbi:ADIPOR-like receptor SPBC12C2.09c [Penicillium verhagenii]|uniref:ADIPOR-like receptor SPBC12C2.09c n=1 Tax=Penicillium verhagenii TaxID=1562060 RepID=UPI0025458AEA|nr:ADIPOR-like receptor SPBC12C2.09c [Penicillium verhagenii]KAJ5919319.1 ADIPOR-like receptor SPBC12C2.09c [Penicillium verhagenii]